jgi:hypothetical protein
MRRFLLSFTCLLFFSASLFAAEPSIGQQFLALIFERQDNSGNAYPHMADAPLWPQGKYLLEGESNQKLHALLDQLVAREAKTQFPNVREKALVQNALWQVFDYMTLDFEEQRDARAKLRPKLVAAIRHLGFSPAELAALPDNLATAENRDLPRLEASDSAWIALSMKDEKPVAAAHTMQLDASAFTVFYKHPDGRAAGLKLLDELAKVPFPLARNERGGNFFPDNAIPVKLPEGMQVALLRRMLLVDPEGRIVASPITQTLQLRTRDERVLQQRERMLYNADARMQEFHLDRAKYLAGVKDSLVAVKPDEREPLVFQAHQYDAYDDQDHVAQHPIVLQHCAACHRDPGTAALHSFTRFFTGTVKENPGLRESTLDRETRITIRTLTERDDWKELQKHWAK